MSDHDRQKTGAKMDFIEKLINEVEKQGTNQQKTSKKFDGEPELIVVRVTKNGEFIEDIEKVIVREIAYREVFTSSFVTIGGDVYFIALCKK